MFTPFKLTLNAGSETLTLLAASALVAGIIIAAVIININKNKHTFLPIATSFSYSNYYSTVSLSLS
jgi:hypothetical protein